MRFVPKQNALYQVRKLPAVIRDLEDRANRIAAACNADDNHDPGEPDGYLTGSQQGAKRPQGRWRATVFTGTQAAKNDNARHQTLIKNLDKGRG
jgi:hypothetical protein